MELILRARHGGRDRRRRAARRKDIAPLVDDLLDWTRRSAPSSRATTTSPRRCTTWLKRVDAFTRFRAAEILGEDEELLWDLAGSLDPEDGCLWIYGTGDEQTMAFTDRGMHSLRELIADHKRNPPPPRP